MLSTTIVHVCARCGSERIRKNGHAINGAQRAKCLDGERTFILEPVGPRYRAAFPASTHRCCGKEEGGTNHVERWFGTLRARVSRLVRKAYAFSKCAENHLDAIHLFITTYNLAIQQKATGR